MMVVVVRCMRFYFHGRANEKNKQTYFLQTEWSKILKFVVRKFSMVAPFTCATIPLQTNNN